MSAPVPLREAVEDVIVLLEEELSDPCTHRRSPVCQERATHLIIHTCCGFEYKLCERHTKALVEFLTTGLTLGLQCRVCKAKDAPFPEIVPLGGAS